MKTLRLIVELKMQVADGKALDQEQLKKIEAEDALRVELATLETHLRARLQTEGKLNHPPVVHYSTQLRLRQTEAFASAVTSAAPSASPSAAHSAAPSATIAIAGAAETAAAARAALRVVAAPFVPGAPMHFLSPSPAPPLQLALPSLPQPARKPALALPSPPRQLPQLPPEPQPGQKRVRPTPALQEVGCGEQSRGHPEPTVPTSAGVWDVISAIKKRRAVEQRNPESDV